ncbi:MAG: DEAD/DEAH box helicase [Verrucomicrobiales bacterium]|nr:DEAD/DEAH box helicase [Verrucomicrobiales bacterium]
MDGETTFYSSLSAPTAKWFRKTFRGPTEAQTLCVPAILEQRSILLSSPTGSGKTLAGFLGIIDRLATEHQEGALPARGVQCIYLSPLRALAYDIEKNLKQPLEGLGLSETITVGMRTGDTTASERAKQRRKPPHILITTPESLAIILPQAGFRDALSRCRFVIIDELHAFVENKRGAHLSISLERIERMRRMTKQEPLCRIGLSATVAPMDTVGEFLCGSGPKPIIAEARIERRAIVEVMTPVRKHPYPPAGYTATRVIRDIAAVVERNRTTLIFTNTRSGAERISHRLKLALPDLNAKIECHHSSLDRDVRQEVEDRLKLGELRAVVCSTSLELGLDIGNIDTVIMVSTPKGISKALQRIGRSGHSIDQMSHGVLVATNINDLIECIVCARLTRDRVLDPVRILTSGNDAVAQHVLGMAMDGGVSADDAFETVTSAYPFRELKRTTFDRIVRYLEGGGKSLEGQYREAFGKIEERDGAYFTVNRKVERDYLVNVGTIHSEGMVNVILNRRRLGSVEENFVKNLKPGDIFVLGGKTVKLKEAGMNGIKVTDAAGRLPTVPSWNANKMPLASGIADEVARLRTLMDQFLSDEEEPDVILDWLIEEWEISSTNASAVLEHFKTQLLLSAIPTKNRFLIEQFQDEENDPERVHFFFHSLIGRSANDALSRIVSYRVKEAVGGNALVTIDDYGFLLSLLTFQKMGVEEWKELFLSESPVEDDLKAALQGAQLVKWQFGGVAQTGLMVPRNLPGKERAIRQLRWSSDILFDVLSEHEPDHPLMEQAYHEAVHTFLDLDRAADFLKQVPGMEWELREVPAVSPFAFGLYASKIRESMMLENPDEAIERLYQTMQKKLGRDAD